MKILRKASITLMVLVSILLFLPSSSHALIDFGVYGGYYFSGDMEWGDVQYDYAELTGPSDLAGWEYGVRGHFTSGIPLLFSTGLGFFLQKAPLEYEIGGSSFDAKKTTYGFDCFAQLEIPIPIHPYVCAGLAINEKVEVKLEVEVNGEETTVSKDYDKYFRSHYYGFGVAFTFFPRIYIFGEYLYTRSKQKKRIVLKGNAIHMGAKISI